MNKQQTLVSTEVNRGVEIKQHDSSVKVDSLATFVASDWCSSAFVSIASPKRPAGLSGPGTKTRWQVQCNQESAWTVSKLQHSVTPIVHDGSIVTLGKPAVFPGQPQRVAVGVSLAEAKQEEQLLVLDLSSNSVVKHFPIATGLTKSAWLSESRLLYVSGKGRFSVTSIDKEKSTPESTEDHGGDVVDFDVNPLRTTIVSADNDQMLTITDVTKNSALDSAKLECRRVRWSPWNLGRCVTACRDKKVSIFDTRSKLASGPATSSNEMRDHITAFNHCSDYHLLIACSDGKLVLVDLRKQSPSVLDVKIDGAVLDIEVRANKVLTFGYGGYTLWQMVGSRLEHCHSEPSRDTVFGTFASSSNVVCTLSGTITTLQWK